MSETVMLDIILSWRVALQNADIEGVIEKLNDHGEGKVEEVDAFIEREDA